MEILKIFLTWLLARLKEPTSWASVCLFATYFGINLAPEWQEQVINIGLAVGGLLTFILSEKGNRIQK